MLTTDLYNNSSSQITRRFNTTFLIGVRLTPDARALTWTTTGTSARLSQKTLTTICSILEAAVESHILKLFVCKVINFFIAVSNTSNDF